MSRRNRAKTSRTRRGIRPLLSAGLGHGPGAHLVRRYNVLLRETPRCQRGGKSLTELVHGDQLVVTLGRTISEEGKARRVT
jgi:hypothetical protein